MARFEITWHTKDDDNVCPVCRPLEGVAWVFDTEKDPFPRILSHPTQGIVWDCDIDEPRTHGDKPHHCRCKLSWRFDTGNVTKKIFEMRQAIVLEFGRRETWSKIGVVYVIRKQGRFAAWAKGEA